MRDLMTFIFCGALAFAAYYYFFADDGVKLSGPKIVNSKQIAAQPSVQIGGAKFTLTNQFGEKVTEKSLLNSKSLVYFGFTSCPAICPAALAVMTEAYVQLGESAAEIKPVFISVDPAVDTPEVMQEYLLNYHKDIVGLTGDKAEIEKLVKSYKAYANKADDGQVMHSDLIYLMDENGKYMTHFNNENTPAQIAEYVRKHKK